MIQHKFIRVNGRIRANKIRLIGKDGKQVGIVDLNEGLKRAQDESLDLVEISPTATPPVCRIVDFGKYLYTLEKQEKEAKKKQHVITIKEIKLSSNIEDHDYQTKLRSAMNFLDRGDKVKVTLTFRGREITRPELGQRVLDRFREDISDIGELERDEGLDRKTITLLFMPKPNVKKLAKSKSVNAAIKTESKVNAEIENKQSGSKTV